MCAAPPPLRYLRTQIIVVDPSNFCPVSNETVIDVYEHVFAPWVKDLGLSELAVSRGQASARLPANPKLNFSSGAICGQVIMAAVDTVVSLAMFTTDRSPKGTVYQHTHTFCAPPSMTTSSSRRKYFALGSRPRMQRQR
jgi:hypothetical protein